MKNLIQMLGLAVLLLVGASELASAQEWRGSGRVGGFVLDDASGQPLEGVVVKATLATSGNRGPDQGKSKKNGEWAVGGVSRGDWAIDFSKEGYEPRSISVQISEGSRIPPMEIRLKKKAAEAADPNVEIKTQLMAAAELM